MNNELKGWRDIEFADLPSRDELAQHIMQQLQKAQRTSRLMRDAWRRSRTLKFSQTTGNWNDTPTDKFVNEHAWVLVDLQERGLIHNLGGRPNEELYCLAQPIPVPLG